MWVLNSKAFRYVYFKKLLMYILLTPLKVPREPSRLILFKLRRIWVLYNRIYEREIVSIMDYVSIKPSLSNIHTYGYKTSGTNTPKRQKYTFKK